MLLTLPSCFRFGSHSLATNGTVPAPPDTKTTTQLGNLDRHEAQFTSEKKLIKIVSKHVIREM